MADIKAVLQTPIGVLVSALIVICLAIAVGSLGHQYWLCTTLAGERRDHKSYIEGFAAKMNAAHIAALNKVDQTIEKQTAILNQMRNEQAEREGKIVSSGERIEAVAVALEWRAREFQKAALQYLREHNQQ